MYRNQYVGYGFVAFIRAGAIGADWTNFEQDFDESFSSGQCLWLCLMPTESRPKGCTRCYGVGDECIGAGES